MVDPCAAGTVYIRFQAWFRSIEISPNLSFEAGTRVSNSQIPASEE